MNLALVGRGRWGANIERTLRDFSDVSLTIVEKGTAPPTDIDGVLIATPSATHAEIAIPFIQKGIATFIEKPMTTSVEDARRLEEAARKSGALVFVGHIHLYNPAFKTALELLPRIGTLQRIECKGMNDRPRTGSSVFWDWLPHDLSIAISICNAPQTARTIEATNTNGIYDSATVEYKLRGVTLTSHISWRSPQKKKLWTFVGEKGTLTLDDTAERRLILSHDGAISYPEYNHRPPLLCELEAFVEAVRTKARDTKSLELGAIVVHAIAAAEESAAKGGLPVSIPLSSSDR